jgi:starch phosphorylase
MINTVPNTIQIEDDRTGISLETLKRAFMDNLFYIQAKFPKIATQQDYYMALAFTIRDRLLNRWLHTTQTYLEKSPRMVAYLSAEFLMGPHLGNNLINLGLYDIVQQAIAELGLDLNELLEQEEEPG